MLSSIAKQLQRGSASVLAVADAPSDRTVPQRVSFCLIAVTAVDPSRSRTEPVPTGTSLRMESTFCPLLGKDGNIGTTLRSFKRLRQERPAEYSGRFDLPLKPAVV